MHLLLSLTVILSCFFINGKWESLIHSHHFSAWFLNKIFDSEKLFNRLKQITTNLLPNLPSSTVRVITLLYIAFDELKVSRTTWPPYYSLKIKDQSLLIGHAKVLSYFLWNERDLKQYI